jgi:hypothetical protein
VDIFLNFKTLDGRGGFPLNFHGKKYCIMQIGGKFSWIMKIQPE